MQQIAMRRPAGDGQFGLGVGQRQLQRPPSLQLFALHRRQLGADGPRQTGVGLLGLHGLRFPPARHHLPWYTLVPQTDRSNVRGAQLLAP